MTSAGSEYRAHSNRRSPTKNLKHIISVMKWNTLQLRKSVWLTICTVLLKQWIILHL